MLLLNCVTQEWQYLHTVTLYTVHTYCHTSTYELLQSSYELSHTTYELSHTTYEVLHTTYALLHTT